MTEAMRVANFSADWGPIFAKMYEKWKKYRKSLKNKISDSHGEIMRLLFIISARCMTANLFPSGQMICSNA